MNVVSLEQHLPRQGALVSSLAFSALVAKPSAVYGVLYAIHKFAMYKHTPAHAARPGYARKHIRNQLRNPPTKFGRTVSWVDSQKQRCRSLIALAHRRSTRIQKRSEHGRGYRTVTAKQVSMLKAEDPVDTQLHTF